jgi:hypothetical protein
MPHGVAPLRMRGKKIILQEKGEMKKLTSLNSDW